jgi:hypothetical protein
MGVVLVEQDTSIIVTAESPNSERESMPNQRPVVSDAVTTGSSMKLSRPGA